MQRYTTQLSIGGRPAKMETKNEKQTSDDKTPEMEIQQEENGPKETKKTPEFRVSVKNEMKKWPLNKEDEKDYLDNFNGVSKSEKQTYLNFFKSADTENLGFIDSRQFYLALHANGINLPLRRISRIFTDLNENCDLLLTVDEFMTGICKQDSRKYTEDDWKALFRQFDRSNTGFITKQDLIRELDGHKIRYTPHNIDDMIRDNDKDLDGKINYKEFRGAWKKHYKC